MTIKVKAYKNGYGLTDGKKWFHYYYSAKEDAESMVKHFDSPERIRVNIALPEPVTFIRNPPEVDQ